MNELLNAIWTRQSDGTQQLTQAKPTAGTITRVTASASSVTLIAANTARRGLAIYNEPTSAILYVSYIGGTASLTNYSVQIPAGGYLEFQIPATTSLITGIWASALGFAQVTELV